MVTANSFHQEGLRASEALPFGALWYNKADDAIGYAEHRSRSHDAVLRVYDDAGNVIATHEHKAISKSRNGDLATIPTGPDIRAYCYVTARAWNTNTSSNIRPDTDFSASL